MDLQQHMSPGMAYTPQELADLIGISLKEMEAMLMDHFQQGILGLREVRGYEFYYLKNESENIQGKNGPQASNSGSVCKHPTSE
jgi:hypothetical protein